MYNYDCAEWYEDVQASIIIIGKFVILQMKGVVLIFFNDKGKRMGKVFSIEEA